MGMKRIAGIVLVAVGLGLVYTGYQMSGALTNQVSEAFSGSPTDSVMLRYVAGVACIAVGGFLAK